MNSTLLRTRSRNGKNLIRSSAKFTRKLAERLNAPHVPSARLSGMRDCYKIKLRSLGYRLVYQVENEVLVVLVIAVGKRERNKVYKTAAKRLG